MTGRVGFIGLGDQGAPMAIAIAEAHDLHVWARNDRSYAGLGDVSFERADGPGALAGMVDFLCLCLPGDAELEDLLFAQNVAAALKPGSVVINHATGDPDAARHIAARLAKLDIAYLDAPVSGGRPGAVARTMTCFVGGDAQTLERCRAIIACHSRNMPLMGAAGAGQMTKLLNNILTVSNMRNVVEAFALARAAGVDLPALQQALKESSGGSFILQAIGKAVTPAIADHIAGLNRKDVAEFAKAMRDGGLDPTVLVDWAMAGPDGLPQLAGELSPAGQ
ncbi:NAD(P)-dependent oxidoreductase [Sphingobium sp.]|uniref:NAD(P)-dependent oxidoreductase n=1 Tax=Sphingobium sp. TaxID=1912891 RepID=UPI003B3BBC0D